MRTRSSTTPLWVRSKIMAVFGVLSILALAVGGQGGAQAADASSTCASSGPTSGAYTVTVCITSPGEGATITGSTTVASTISVTGTNPGVRELIFTISGSKLIWDFESPYTFTLDSTRWMDGDYAIQVYARMRDGFDTATTTQNVAFSNGITTPPVNSSTFSPATGSQPPSGQPFVLAAAGDGASGQTSEASVVNLISSWNPNLFLYLGDVYEDGRPMEFNNWYGQPGALGTYGQFYSISDPAIGNHEYAGSDISGYEWYWNNVPHYYSFNAGGWHFVSLDNVSNYIGNGSSSNANYQAESKWLQNDLGHNKLACTIVYYHEPLFNVGPEGSASQTAGIWQIMAQNQVTIVLNGHDHDYQRWVPLDANGNPSPAGVTEFVAGAGGHGLQQQVTTDSRLAASDFTDFGALRLTLSTSGAGYQYVTTSGTTVDSGSIPCQGSGTDTQPPSQPQGLTATALSRTQVQLSWSPSTDNVGVTSYDIYRDGAEIASIPPPTGYLDESVEPGASYTYSVVARDAAGNSSQPSDPASVTTPTDAAMFSDGFETGDMSQWTTSTGMTVQSQLVNDGAYAAEADASGTTAYAYKQLSQTWPSLYYSARFYVASHSSGSIYLMRFRTSTTGAIAALFISSTGKLGIRNDTTSTTTTSATAVSSGAWHTVEFYASINGTSSQITVWLDGTQVNDLSGTQSLGTTPIGYLQLGSTSSASFSVIFDDVQADPLFLQP